MSNQTSNIENNFLKPLTKGFFNGITASIVPHVFPKLIPITPAVSAVFMSTMTVTQEFSNFFFRYCLEKMGYNKEANYYIFFGTEVTASSIGFSVASMITTVALHGIQLLSLWFLSICGGALLYYIIVPATSINETDAVQNKT